MIDILIPLIVSLLCGVAIGMEREVKGKPAGIRTCALVCLGSTVYCMLSTLIDGANVDHGRIASNVVQGIGFLGAGAIITTQGSHVVGLTTAAIIWTVAAIGMAIGLGHYQIGISTTAMTLLVTVVISMVEYRFFKHRYDKENKDENKVRPRR